MGRRGGGKRDERRSAYRAFIREDGASTYSSGEGRMPWKELIRGGGVCLREGGGGSEWGSEGLKRGKWGGSPSPSPASPSSASAPCSSVIRNGARRWHRRMHFHFAHPRHPHRKRMPPSPLGLVAIVAIVAMLLSRGVVFS